MITMWGKWERTTVRFLYIFMGLSSWFTKMGLKIGKITKLSKCKQNGQFGDDLPVSFFKVL